MRESLVHWSFLLLFHSPWFFQTASFEILLISCTTLKSFKLLTCFSEFFFADISRYSGPGPRGGMISFFKEVSACREHRNGRCCKGVCFSECIVYRFICVSIALCCTFKSVSKCNQFLLNGWLCNIA